MIQSERRKETFACPNRRIHDAAPHGEWLSTEVRPVLIEAIEDRVERWNLTFLKKLKAGNPAVV
jgi:hypothetical protein